MANQDVNNLVNTVVDTQKHAVDTVVENTMKFSGGNNMINETIQKGGEWYKNWLDAQKQFFAQASERTTNASGNMQQQMSQMSDVYQNWFNMQTNWAKQMAEANMAYFQNANSNANHSANMNPMAAWQNMMQQWNNWFAGVNNMGQWMNQMQQWNNLFNMDGWKNASQNWNALFNQYMEIVNSNVSKMQESMQNGTSQDAYRNMVNAADAFSRFYEMWMPMWKSIQEKTFNMDLYKQWMNPMQYKDLMDKYFGFLPEAGRQYMQQMTGMMQDGWKQMSTAGMQQYHQMRHTMANMMPGMTGADMFRNMLHGYNTMYNMMNDAYAPFTKMMTPNQQTKTMMEWQDIANRLAVYNIKNAELQYMVYTQGAKVMDSLAENTLKKMQGGEEISSIMALYQEWMNIADRTFVQLFESDEYSQLMAEVSSMQLKLRKDMEQQMEKFMVGFPVATRSEMDEVYKTIYDLKKQVRDMERTAETPATTPVATASPTPVSTVEATEEPTEEKASRKTSSTSRKA